MVGRISVQELPDHNGDFSVLIGWSEQMDRPLHNALLVSASRATVIEEKPHWSYAVISPEELSGLLDVLAANVDTLFYGPYVSDEPEYFVEIELGEQTYNCGLGFNRRTIAVVALLAGALEPENQLPLHAVIAAIRPMIGDES